MEGPTARVLQIGTELAFGVRMISPQRAIDESGAAHSLPDSDDAGGTRDVSRTPDTTQASVWGSGAPPSPPSGTSDCAVLAVASLGISSTTGPGGSVIAPSERRQSEHTEVAESAHGAPGPPSGNDRSELKDGTRSDTGGDSGEPENQRAAVAAALRDTWPRASATTKSGASCDPPPSGQGDNPSAWPVDMAWVGNAPAVSPSEGERTPAPSTQETEKVRAAEEPPEPPVPAVSHEVSLHLADDENRVDIRLAEHAGEVRVTVHTPDRDLADSLRADLPDLVGKLHQNGFQAEVWRPTGGQAVQGRRGLPDGSTSQEHSPGGRKDGRQQPHAQRSKDRSRRTGEWQSSLDRAQEIQK